MAEDQTVVAPWVLPDGRSPQREFILAARTTRTRVFRAGNKVGKALRDDWPVLLASGEWRPIARLVPGDRVVGSDGRPCAVIAVHPQGVVDLLRVTFNDGSETVCCADHLWKCKPREARFPRGSKSEEPGEWEVLSTGEILRRWGPHPRPVQRVAIPLVEPIRFPPATLPLDPYGLGVLLGDGCFRGGSVSFTCEDVEVADEMARRGWDLARQESRDVPTWGVRGVLPALRKLGLMGLYSHDKHVPDAYLLGSPGQRLSLLRGLMDTDGTAAKRGSVSFSTTSENLRDAVVDMVRGLGGVVNSVNPRTTHYRHKGEKIDGRTSWRVRFRLIDACPFTLERKAERWAEDRGRRRPERLMVAIEPAGRGSATCVTVDSPDGTFVTRDHVVTHNSFALIYDMLLAATGQHPAQHGRAPNMRKPPIDLWPVGVDYGHGIAADLWPLFDTLAAGFPELAGALVLRTPDAGGRRYNVGQRNVPGKIVVLANGSRITFKSADSKTDKFSGTPIDWLGLNEEIPEDVAEESRRGLVTRGGHCAVAATPVRGLDWIRRLEDRPTTAVIRASMLDAVEAGIADEQAVRDYLDSLPPRQRLVRELGDYAALEGAVYPEFARATHCAQARDGGLWLGDDRLADWPLPATWPRRWAIDFGFANPCCPGVAVLDPWTGRVWIETVYYQRHVGPSEWARYLKELREATPQLQGMPIVADHGSGERFEIERAGTPTVPAAKGPESVSAGVGLVQRWLWKRLEDGHPKLVLVEDENYTHPELGRCDGAGRDRGGLRWEFENYAYPESTGLLDPRDQPRKKNDHGMDMIRYLLTDLENPRSSGPIPPPDEPAQDDHWGDELDGEERGRVFRGIGG